MSSGLSGTCKCGKARVHLPSMISHKHALTFFLLVQTVVTFGLGKKFPFQFLGENGLQIGAFFWGVVSSGVLLTFFSHRLRERLLILLQPKYLWLLLGVFTLLNPLYDAFQWVKFGELGYSKPTFLWIWDAFGIGLWGWLYQRRVELDSPLAVFVSAVFAGIHRAISIAIFPLASERSDLFAAILQANERIFSLGLPAYGPSWGGVGQIPYLPLSWLSFFPAHFFAIDPRWMGLLLFGVTLLLIVRTPRLFSKRNDLKNFSPALLLTFFLSNPYLHFRHELYLDPWLFLLTAALVSVRYSRPVLTGSITGLACSTLHWAWTLFPFLWGLASLSSHRRERFKKFTLTLVSSLVFFIPIMGYFAIREKEVFFPAIFLHQDKINTGTNPGELCLGFASLFFELGIEWALQPIQTLLLLGLGSLGSVIWWKAREGTIQVARKQIFLLLWTTGFVFNLFVPFLENYFMLSWMLAAILVLNEVSEPNTPTPELHSSIEGFGQRQPR